MLKKFLNRPPDQALRVITLLNELKNAGDFGICCKHVLRCVHNPDQNNDFFVPATGLRAGFEMDVNKGPNFEKIQEKVLSFMQNDLLQ